MKEKIKKLRTILPIPLLEAKQLLEENGGDIETCVYLYMAKAIKLISDETGYDKQEVEKFYRAEKFDINRTISVIKDEIYDKNYKPIDGLDRNGLQVVKEWLYLIETENFSYALEYKQLDKAIATLSLIPNLEAITKMMLDVKRIYDEIFKNYDHSQPLDEFVRLNRLLDDAPEFQLANEQVPLQLFYIKNEISKHWRNI